MKLVVDSSVIVKWLNAKDEKHLDQADLILSGCQNGLVKIYAPELSKYEVGNALMHKNMTGSQTKTALSVFYSLPIKFIELEEDEGLRILEIAEENKITYYDSAFIALAEKIKADLVTDNVKHQNKGIIKIIALENYGNNN